MNWKKELRGAIRGKKERQKMQFKEKIEYE